MLRLARFVKPFLGSITLAILLLFVQVLCDLNLPNLMSDIVNVGIQQGGVEDRSPVAISSEGFELTRTFMDSDQQALLEESYELVFPGDLAPDSKPWSERYPSGSSDGFYVLKAEVGSDTRAQLDEAFGLSTWTMVYVLQEFAAHGIENLGITLPPEALSQFDTDTSLNANIEDIDFTALYDALPLFELIPQENMDVFRQQAAQTDELTRNSSATLLVRNFYRELGVNMDDYEIGYIVRIGLIMLLITVVGGAATILVGLLSSRAGAGIARNLRSAVFKKVLAFSHTEFDRFSTASLITRSTNDVTQIQMLVSLGIRMLFYAPIMGVGAFIMALQKSADMSWIMGVAAIFMVGMMGLLMVIVMPKFKIIQRLIDRLNLVARETLNGQMVIRAFSRSGFEMDRFEKANADVTNTNLFIQRAMVFMMPIMMIFMNGLTVLIIWIGSEQVAASHMQVGDMMAYMQYAMMMVMSFMFIAMAFILVPRAAVSAGRIADVLDTKPVIKDPVNPVALPDDLPKAQRGRVEFRDVSFCYEGAEACALEKINFIAEPGATTAIIGSTGSGKSTILNLIPRFYDVSEGSVLFDGVDVRELTTHDLRSRIGYVPQKSLLISGTITENIAYGNPSLPLDDMRKIAKVAQALDFIEKLDVSHKDDADSAAGSVSEEAETGEVEGGTESEAGNGVSSGADSDTAKAGPGEKPDSIDAKTMAAASQVDEAAPSTVISAVSEAVETALAPGFDFEIAQGGSNVSGGQRQRLAIARALAVNPEVFLFDDSFSALDFATDAALRKALATYTGDATIIIVAQRVSTIMDAESIYVIDEGRIIGQGTHAELLRSCSAYRDIAETQLSPEEIQSSLGGDVR